MAWMIVSDSSCEIRELKNPAPGVQFALVPFKIRVGEREYVDLATLNTQQMLQAMTDYNGASTTACPSPEEWAEYFLQADNVFALTISSNLSGSYNAAMAAREMVLEEHPEKKEEYLELLVNLQLEMHSKTCPLLNKLKDKMSRKISQTDLSATVRYDLHTRLEAMPKHNKVCHGDFNPSNIIISDNGDPYIIDWSHATQGNASADAARTYLLFCLNGDIDGAKKYLQLFCDKSNTPIQYVQTWLPIVAASQTVKGNEKEREFLLSWIDVVDYE